MQRHMHPYVHMGMWGMLVRGGCTHRCALMSACTCVSTICTQKYVYVIRVCVCRFLNDVGGSQSSRLHGLSPHILRLL